MNSLDYFAAGIARASARAKDRRNKQLTEQQEIQSVQEKIQQQLLVMADLKAQIEVFKNTDSATTTTTIDANSTTDKISDEQYQTMIIQKMITHIKSKG
ncbi:hypothetical protein D3C75_1046490 [compost metagenome]